MRKESTRNLFIWWQWSTEGLNKSEIAKYHGISHERVTQIIRRCEIKRLTNNKQFLNQLANAF